MLVSLQLAVSGPLVVWLADEMSPHDTEQSWLDIFAITSTVYFCIKGKTLSFHRGADNDINEYLIDAGDWKHMVYQPTFKQGLSNHFVNPGLDLTLNSHEKAWLSCKILKWFLNQIPCSPRFESGSDPRYKWVFNTHEHCILLYFLLINVFILDECTEAWIKSRWVYIL